MKKIGFIDYYLNEWHANNYPELIKNAAGDEMKVCYAYGEVDAPNGVTNEEWARKHNVELVDTIEKLVELSDYIVVLAPDNPETHVRLSDYALKSGKPVFVDKTFSLNLADAKTIFETANANNTPCYSSSALYFSEELKEVKKENISRITSIGSGKFEIYLVHQLEQIVSLMGFDAKRVMYLGDNPQSSVMVEFEGSRYAEINFYGGQGFSMVIGYNDNSSYNLEVKKDFWPDCIMGMTEFFRTQIPPVSQEQTLCVVGVIEAAIKAKNKPFEWVDVE